MLTAVLGCLGSVLFGAVVGWFNLPAPAPPHLYGALLVVCVTLGYQGGTALRQESATDKDDALNLSADVSTDMSAKPKP